MSTVFEESRRTFGHQFAERLEQRGVPHQYVSSVLDTLQELIPGPATVALTESELDFVRAAGIPESVFSTEVAEENALYEAASAVVLERELRASLLSTSAVARMLGKDAAHVRRMLSEGRLMAAGQLDGQRAYPRWQLVDGQALPGLRTVLAAFPRDYHPLDIQKVMTSPAEELGGRSPQEWLATGGDVAPVVALVSDLAYM